MTREEQIMNDPDLQCYVDKKRGWINEAFKDGVDWADKELANASVIHWQTGKPPCHGDYLVSMSNGEVCHDRYTMGNYGESIWQYEYDRRSKVIAWCNIGDIKPPQQ